MKLSTADLLRAGKSERMRSSARALMADSVAASLVGAVGASAGAGAFSAVSAKTLLSVKAWLALSLGVVMVGSFATWSVSTSGSTSGALAPAAPLTPVQGPGARALRPSAPAPLPAATSGTPRLDGKAKASGENEIESLVRVRERLRAGAPAEALALLAVHSRKFPHGLLAEEARVLRIQALHDTDPAKARSEAAAFLRDSPESPYRARMEGIANP